MLCRSCGHTDSKVIDSRSHDDGKSIRRRRACEACGYKFTTFETAENIPLMIIKKNGSRQVFSAEKLRGGLVKALEKLPISRSEIDLLVHETQKYVISLDKIEIKSSVIGEFLMERLKKLDKAAYLRFASVHKGFKNIHDWSAEIEKL